MSTRLNQIIAVVNGKKTKHTAALTEIYHKLQKAELFSGFSKRYFPKNEESENFPTESKIVQTNVDDTIDEAKASLSDLFDCILTQEVGNTQAKADIKIGTEVLATNVPVTYMLFLEKQLTDVRAFVTKLPVLDQSDIWKYDDNRNSYVTDPTRTHKTKKVNTVVIKYEATDKHPAQTEILPEDIKVGEYENVKFSGAMPVKEKKEMLERVDKLIEAVKKAREEANNTEVVQMKIADNLLGYVFS